MKRRNKYNAVSCTCNQNHTHGSRAEATYCNNLHLDMRAQGSQIAEIQNQPTVILQEHPRRTWRLDFRVVMADGTSYLIDVKGMWTPATKLKCDMYRQLLYDGKAAEPLLIAPAHHGRGLVTFSEIWYR